MLIVDMRTILKFIGSVLGIILFISMCCCEDQRKAEKEQYQKVLQNDTEYNIHKIEYEEHTYLIWTKGKRGGICHDENCHCK